MSEKSTKKRKAKTAWAYGRPKAALRKREAAITKHKTAQKVPQPKPDDNAWFSFPLENWRSSMFTSLAPVLDQVTKTVAAINPLQEQEDSKKQPGITTAKTVASVVQHSNDHVLTTDLNDQLMSSIEPYISKAPSVVAAVPETDQVTLFDQERESQVPSGPVLQLAKASLSRSSDSTLGSTALTKKTSMASNTDPTKSIGLTPLKSAALSKDLDHAKKFPSVPHSAEAIRPFTAHGMSVAPASFAPVCVDDTQLSRKVKAAFSARSSFSNDPCVVCPADNTACGMNEKRQSRELGMPLRQNTDAESLSTQLLNKETKNQSGVLMGADIVIPDKALRTEVHDNVPLLDPMCPVPEKKTQAGVETDSPVVPKQRALRYSVLQQTLNNVKVMEVSDKQGSFREKTANTLLKERLSQQVLDQSFALKAAEEKSPVQSNVRQRLLSSQSWSRRIDTLQSASYSDTCLAKQAAVQNKPIAVAYHDHGVENTQETLLYRQRSLRSPKREAQLLLPKDLKTLATKKAELETRQMGFDEHRKHSAKQSWTPPKVEIIDQNDVSLTEQNKSVVAIQSKTSLSSFSSSSLHDTLTRSESAGQTPFPMRTRLTQGYVDLMATSIVDHPTFPTLQTGTDNSKLVYRAVSSAYQEQPQRSGGRPSTLQEEESSVLANWAPTLKQRTKATFLGQNAMAVNAVTVETRNTLMENAFSKQNVSSREPDNRSGMTQKGKTEWRKAQIPQSIASQSDRFQIGEDMFQIDHERPSLTKRLSSVSNGYPRHEATPLTILKDVSSLKKTYTTSEDVLELENEAPAYSSGTLSEASNNLPDEMADQRFKLTSTRPQKSSCEKVQSGHIKTPAEYLTRRSIDAETNVLKHRDTLQAETCSDLRATATTNPPQRDFTTHSVKQGETLNAYSDAAASEKCEDQKIRNLDNEAVIVKKQESKVPKLEQAQLKEPQEVPFMLSEPNHSIQNLKAAHRVSHQLTKEEQSRLVLPPLTATEPSKIPSTPETFYLLPKVNVLRKNETPSVPPDNASLFASERRRSSDTQEAAAVSLDMRYVERKVGSGMSSAMPPGTTSPSERQTCQLGSAETTTAIPSSMSTTNACIPRLKKASIRRQESILLRLAKQPLLTYAPCEHDSKAAKWVPLQHENPIRQETERETAAVRQIEQLVKPQVKPRTAMAQKNGKLKREEVKATSSSLSDSRTSSMRSGKKKSASPTTVPSAHRDVTAKPTMKDSKNIKRPAKQKVKSVGKPQAADQLPCLDIKAVLNLIDAAESETQSLQAIRSAKSYASTSWLQLSQELVKQGNVDAYSASVPRELLWLLGANALFGPPSEWNAYLRTVGAVFCRRLRLKETQFVELQRLILTAATKAKIGARAAAILPDLLYT